jgi:outer membrane scaffolding protein for murein synthesis (MipA/OmpV family)
MTILNTTASLAALTTAVLLATGTAAAAQEEDEGGGFLVLGLGAAFEPVFNGSDQTQVEPDPIIEARYGRFFIGELGVGADIFVSDGPSELTFGAAVGLGEGRKEEDDTRLAGLGDLDGAVELALFAEAEWGPVEFDAAVVTDVGSGHGGTFLEFGVGFENTLSDRLSYEVELSTVYGNDSYANAFYGVSSSQAARSGHAAFSPGAGFTEASLDLSMRYAITDTWFAEASVGVGTLLGEARNAPFVAQDTFTSATIGIGRVFRF